MSFKIFASGLPNFHYTNDNCIDDSDLDMIDLLGDLQGLELTKSGVISTVIDIFTPGVVDAMMKVARIESLHLLNNAVSSLAMKTQAESGWIFVSAMESHLLWPTTGGTAKYEFYPCVNPGLELMQQIGPALDAGNMTNWGVLRELAICIAKYGYHTGSDRPILNINLSR
ncbi:MAG: hypothetical protein Q7T35_08105 [Nitrosomonas sp.]|jgi:hypothetical protein|nr:hypothetical protein [Nitrosomonas sp.]